MIGNIIKSKRQELNLTIQDLADKLHVTKATISRYENNVIENIPLDKLLLLSKVLQITPSELLGYNTTIDNDILFKYNVLDEHGKELIKTILDIEFKRCINNNY